MMIAVPILLLLVALFQTTTTSVQYAQKVCRTEDDCDWDQCCIEAETRFPGFNGICDTPTQKGEICNPDPRDKTEDGRYRIACPCAKGLSCQSREESSGTRVYHHHVCQP